MASPPSCIKRIPLDLPKKAKPTTKPNSTKTFSNINQSLKTTQSIVDRYVRRINPMGV